MCRHHLLLRRGSPSRLHQRHGCVCGALHRQRQERQRDWCDEHGVDVRGIGFCSFNIIVAVQLAHGGCGPGRAGKLGDRGWHDGRSCRLDLSLVNYSVRRGIGSGLSILLCVVGSSMLPSTGVHTKFENIPNMSTVRLGESRLHRGLAGPLVISVQLMLTALMMSHEYG